MPVESEKLPSLGMLLCSGYTDERSRWHAIEEKKFRFLQKPYPPPNSSGPCRRCWLRTMRLRPDVSKPWYKSVSVEVFC